MLLISLNTKNKQKNNKIRNNDKKIGQKSFHQLISRVASQTCHERVCGTSNIRQMWSLKFLRVFKYEDDCENFE